MVYGKQEEVERKECRKWVLKACESRTGWYIHRRGMDKVTKRVHQLKAEVQHEQHWLIQRDGGEIPL